MSLAVLLAMFKPLLPVLVGTFSPLVTSFVKKGVESVSQKIPNSVVPLVNAVIGAVVGGLAGDPIGGLVGSKLGQTVRDQVAK